MILLNTKTCYIYNIEQKCSQALGFSGGNRSDTFVASSQIPGSGQFYRVELHFGD